MSRNIRKMMVATAKKLSKVRNLDTRLASKREIQERHRLVKTARICLMRVEKHMKILERDVADMELSSEDEEDLTDTAQEGAKEDGVQVGDNGTDTSTDSDGQAEKEEGGEQAEEEEGGGHVEGEDNIQQLIIDRKCQMLGVCYSVFQLFLFNASQPQEVFKRFRNCFKNVDEIEQPTGGFLDRILHANEGSLREQENRAFANLHIHYIDPGEKIMVSGIYAYLAI